jgi:hypothetical protein
MTRCRCCDDRSSSTSPLEWVRIFMSASRGRIRSSDKFPWHLRPSYGTVLTMRVGLGLTAGYGWWYGT